MKLNYFLILLVIMMLFFSSGCGSSSSNNFTSVPDNNQDQNDGSENNNQQEEDNQGDNQQDNNTSGDYLTSADIDVQQELSNSTDGEHVIELDGKTQSYSNLGITKTGDSDGEDADFYGENSAVFATNSATLTLTKSLIITDGAHANAIFSYGEGTIVNVSESVIITRDNNSGGIMTTGGGTMNANNLTIETAGGSSAAIRSDRGGGTVNVTNGTYTASGRGSPAIYSTADITVSSAHLESKTAQGIVIEGKNSVTLNNCELAADNNTHNSDNSTRYQAIMIYQSGSGDASDGKGTFTASNGSITNVNGDIFFINNTAADITLNDVNIENNDEDGVFMRAEAAGWGTSGSNGGKVNLYANDQLINDNIVVDDVSILNFYLKSSSTFIGAINNENSSGQIYVELSDSTWTLTGDSYITSLTCEADSISLNGYTLYVNGTAYTEGTASTGEAIEISTGSSGNSGGGNTPPDVPNGGPGNK